MNEKIRNVLLSVTATIAAAILIGVWKFYRDWTIDEQTEDAVMFDNPEQKVRTVDHAEKIQVDEMKVKMANDASFQNEVLNDLHKIMDRLDAQDSINRRTHDQIYQINQRNKN